LIFDGHGRPLLGAKKNPDAIPADLILRACTESTEFLAEDSHAPYLAELIEASSKARDIKDELYSRLRKRRKDLDQLLDVASVFASRGDSMARRAIRIGVERNLRSGSLEGIYAVAKGLGKKGLKFLLDTLDSLPPDHLSDEAWNDLYWRATTYVPREKGDQYLQEFEATSATAKRLLQERDKTKPNEPVRKITTAKEFLASWEGGHRERGTVSYFVKNASEAEFSKAAQTLPSVENDKHWYLRTVFRDRPYPLEPETLFPLAVGSSGRVAGAAFGILKRIVSPSVRSFGMKHLWTKGNGSMAVDLLVANYKPGDEERIRLRAERSTTRLDLHQTLLTLLQLVEKRPDLESKYLEYLYERVPCCTCRYSVVKLLIQRKQITDSQIEECLYDADFATRGLANKEKRKRVGKSRAAMQ